MLDHRVCSIWLVCLATHFPVSPYIAEALVYRHCILSLTMRMMKQSFASCQSAMYVYNPYSSCVQSLKRLVNCYSPDGIGVVGVNRIS